MGNRDCGCVFVDCDSILISGGKVLVSVVVLVALAVGVLLFLLRFKLWEFLWLS